jgi:hypothetical protein
LTFFELSHTILMRPELLGVPASAVVSVGVEVSL